MLSSLKHSLPPALQPVTVAGVLLYLSAGTLACGLHYNVRVPWRKNYPLIVHLSIEALLIFCFQDSYRTLNEDITFHLQRLWKSSYESDWKLILTVQEDYNCCGFQDIGDMVIPPLQDPTLSADREGKRQTRSMDIHRLIIEACGILGCQTRGLCEKETEKVLTFCAKTNNRTVSLCDQMKTETLHLCEEVNQTLALCAEAIRLSADNVENQQTLASFPITGKHRCISDQSCLGPWGRYLQVRGGWLLLAVMVGFLIKVRRTLLIQ